MLIAFGGLPGVGKTTLAKALAKRQAAVYLRIDTIEQAVRDGDVLVISIMHTFTNAVGITHPTSE